MFLPDSSKPIFTQIDSKRNNDFLFEGLFGRKQTTLNIQTPPKKVFDSKNVPKTASQEVPKHVWEPGWLFRFDHLE